MLGVEVADAEPPVTAHHRVDCRLCDSQGDRQRLALSPVLAAEMKLLSSAGEHERHFVRSTMFERGGEHHRPLKLKVKVARGLTKRPPIVGCGEVETGSPGRVSRLRNDRRSILVALPVCQRRHHAAEHASVVIRPAPWVCGNASEDAVGLAGDDGDLVAAVRRRNEDLDKA